jgi:hypothetical protein
MFAAPVRCLTLHVLTRCPAPLDHAKELVVVLVTLTLELPARKGPLTKPNCLLCNTDEANDVDSSYMSLRYRSLGDADR